MSIRPSWRVDLKWVCAIVCLFSILIACLAYSARALTSHDTATGIFSAAAGGFAASQIDDGEWESIKSDAAADPDQTVALPGIKPEVLGGDIAGLTKQEATIVAMAPVADVNYAEGSDAALRLLDLEDENGGEFSLGPLGSLTSDNHDALQPFLIGSLIIAVLSATALFAFARGPGRAGGVSAVTALATAGFALIWTLVDHLTGGVTKEDGAFAYELGQSISPAAGDLATTFLTIFLLTSGITVASIIAHFGETPVRKAWARYRQTVEPATTESATDDEPGSETAPEAGPSPAGPGLGAHRTLRPS